MRKILLLATIYITLLMVSVKAYSQAGSLDPSFDGDGIALYDFTGFHETAWYMATLADTSILLCGTTNVSDWFVSDGYLMKLNPDGSRDSTWGTNGMVTYDYGEDTYFYNMIVLDDGKILVSGTVYITTSDSEFFASKFNPDGTPDLSFGTNGTFTSSYTTEQENGECMAIQPDGKIVMAGRTYSGAFSQLLFLRINADGTLDTSFGSNGYTEINASIQDERINAVGVLSSGTIVGAGYGYQSSPWFGEQAVIAKLGPDGTPMTSFGTNGVIIPSFVSDISVAFAMKVRNDSMFVTGYQNDAANDQELFFTKLDSSAVADPSFANGGISLVHENPKNVGSDIFLNTDQKIYVCGTSGLGGMFDRDFFLLRYLPDGTLDPSFNTTGYVTTPVRPDWDEAYAVDLQVDGKIVCAGMSGGLTSSGNNDVPVARYLNDWIPFGAHYTASETLICEGSTVSFTDQSSGSIIGWEWTFEGGSPATSTAQNPTVTYNTAGDYDVQLIVTDGVDYDTMFKADYISVIAVPGQAGTPVGGDNACAGATILYTTNSVQYAETYQWEVNPPDAGSITGTDTTGTFESSATWSGSYAIKVRASNMCGYGPWSGEFQGTLVATPLAFQLEGEGAYCEGSQGAELTLDGSETGVDYELYLDDVATGNIIAGTGSPISFGYVADEGIYTAKGFSGSCENDMYGQIWVHMIGIPGQAGTPEGPEEVCNDTTTIYTTSGATDADTLIWSLTPADAGILTGNGMEATIEWSVSFSGTAFLSVLGENECGTGPASDDLEIEVFMSPSPEISGLTLVCEDDIVDYLTQNNPGNTYAWEVEGGEIISGAGTHSVSVQWGEPGTGILRVTEESAEGCSTITDNYVVTIDECTHIAEFYSGNIRIYPNPGKDLVTIRIHDGIGKNPEIYIYNQYGQVICSAKVTQGTENCLYDIDVSSFADGIYFVSIHTTSGGKFHSKFMVKK